MRVEVAKEKLKADAQTELVAALRSETTALRATIETERVSRVDAEKKLASAEAARDELRRHVEQLTSTVKTLEGDVDQLQATLDTERGGRVEAEKKLAKAEAQRVAAEQRADDLQGREKVLREELVELRKPKLQPGPQMPPKSK